MVFQPPQAHRVASIRRMIRRAALIVVLILGVAGCTSDQTGDPSDDVGGPAASDTSTLATAEPTKSTDPPVPDPPISPPGTRHGEAVDQLDAAIEHLREADTGEVKQVYEFSDGATTLRAIYRLSDQKAAVFVQSDAYGRPFAYSLLVDGRTTYVDASSFDSDLDGCWLAVTPATRHLVDAFVYANWINMPAALDISQRLTAVGLSKDGAYATVKMGTPEPGIFGPDASQYFDSTTLAAPLPATVDLRDGVPEWAVKGADLDAALAAGGADLGTGAIIPTAVKVSYTHVGEELPGVSMPDPSDRITIEDVQATHPKPCA